MDTRARATTNKITQTHSQSTANCSVVNRDANAFSHNSFDDSECITSISKYCTLRPRDAKFWENFIELCEIMDKEVLIPKEKIQNFSFDDSDDDEFLEELGGADYERLEEIEIDEEENDNNNVPRSETDNQETNCNSFKYCTLKKPTKRHHDHAHEENFVGNLGKYCTLKLSNEQVMSLTQSEEYKSLCCMIENHKLEKCLSDLDSYLERTVSDDGEEDDQQGNRENDHHTINIEPTTDLPTIHESKRRRSRSEKCLTFPKHQHSDDNNFNRSVFRNMSLYVHKQNCDNPVQKSRVVAGSNNKHNNSEYDQTAGCSQKVSSRRQTSWLRNSMRYSVPVVLPEPNESPPLASAQTNNTLKSTLDQNENRLDLRSEFCHIRNSSLPRQQGRRSNPFPRLTSITSEISDRGEVRIISHQQRMSMPENDTNNFMVNNRNQMPSEPSSLGSSRNPSPVSIATSTASSSLASTRDTIDTSPPPITTTVPVLHTPSQRSRSNRSSTNSDESQTGSVSSTTDKKMWPHLMSRSLCSVCCTVGLFNISRFSVLSVLYGGNFLVQFLILSTVFGIPFMWFQMCLGAKIKGGMVTMFKISPICKGIGITLMITQGVIALYSNISIIWIFNYLKDTIVLNGVQYNWQESYKSLDDMNNSSFHILKDNYFSSNVLKRFHARGMGSVKFQLVMCLLLLWSLVFLALFKGIKSFGRVVFPIISLAFVGLLVVCIKFAVVTKVRSFQELFPQTEWQEFFVNSNSWVSACQETFLTWGLLGCSIYVMYCKRGPNQENKVVLRREAFFVAFFTLLVLFISAVLSNSCANILKAKLLVFGHRATDTLQSFSMKITYHPRYLTVLGDNIKTDLESPQVLRLVSELIPMTLGFSRTQINPIWGTIAFFSLILFGLGQMCAMWLPIGNAVGSNPSAILLSCVCGFFLGIPLVTDNGIVIVRYLDFVFGGAWWILIIWTLYLIAIFMIRGRPYTSDVVVKDLKLNETLSAFIAFSWNVLLPVALVLLSIMKYKISHSDELFQNRQKKLYYLSTWYNWARHFGGYIQLGMLAMIPIIGIIQIYRYLSKGPPDILERLQLLYRPALDSSGSVQTSTVRQLNNQRQQAFQRGLASRPPNAPTTYNDDPPKYATLTPPPSYNAATGLRVVKMLRNSIRRSVRRFRQNNTQSVPVDVPVVLENPRTETNATTSATEQPPTRNLFRSLQRNITNSIRSSMRGRDTLSVDNLVFSEVPPSISTPNQSSNADNNSNQNSSVV